MVGLIQPDEDMTLDEVKEIAEAAEQDDLVVAIEKLKEVEAADSDEELDDDEIVLPFYEDDRELAFVIGMIVGGVLQQTEGTLEAK